MALPSLSRIPAPPDPILGLAEAFRNDPRPGKINLSSGVFVDESGTTPVLPTVTEAERRILAKGATKLYRPIDGDAAYRAAVQAYVFGEGHELATSGRVAVSQTPGGTGGLRVAADFLRQAGAAGDDLDERADLAEPSPALPGWRASGSGPTPTPIHPAGASTRRRSWPRSARRRPATRSCSTARATTRPASTPRPPSGARSATSSRSAASSPSSTSPTRASATGSARTPTGWTGSSGRAPSS